MYEIVQEVITYLRSMWRYRWYAMILTWVIVAIGWTVVLFMPNQYTASARVHVNTESVLRPLMRGLTIEPNVQQRLLLLTRTLLSRPNLEKLVRNTDMDIQAQTKGQMDAILDNLASNISLRSSRGGENIYSFDFTSTNPKLAKDIVQNLLNILMESTLGQSRESSNSAQEFLERQLKDYETRLLKAEKNLQEFKQKNSALMPTLREGYFVSLQTNQKNLAESQLMLREAKRRRDELRRQLTGEDPVFGFSNDSSDENNPNSPIVIRIKKMEKQRDDLLLEYTDLHPKIIALENTIGELELRLEKEKESQPEKQPQSLGNSLKTNPVYQQIRISLAQAEAEVSGLTVRVHEYRSKTAKLEKMVNDIPAVEAELKRLSRDYEVNSQRYNDIVQRRETASISERVEETGEGVRIKVIDPPHVDSTPSGPNRIIFNSVVLFLGLGAGIGLAFLISQLRPVVHDAKALRQITGLPIFGSVSRIWTPEMLHKKRIEYGGFVFVFVLLLVFYLALLSIRLG